MPGNVAPPPSPLAGLDIDDLAAEHQVVYTGARRHSRLLVNSLRVLAVVAILVVWQLGSGHIISAFFFTKPTEIFKSLGSLITSGSLVRNGLTTLKEAAIGYVLGAVIGIGFGALCARLRLLGEVVDPLIVSVFSIPHIAIAPLIILWFGVGQTPKIFLAALGVFYTVFYVTYGAVGNVSREFVNTVTVMGGNRRQVFRQVVMPSSMGYIYVALRMSVPHALLGAITGEILAGNQGLGYLVNSSATQFNIGDTFAVLFALAVLGLITNRLVAYTGRKLQKWNPDST